MKFSSDINYDRRVTLDNILEKVSPEDIFSFYLKGKVSSSGYYSSPFRKDNRPSASLYYNSAGKLIFKDFGNGFNGDFVDFIKKLYSTNFKGALNIINKEMGLGLAGGVMTYKKVGYDPISVKERSNIAVIPRKFNAYEDKNFWYTKYGITGKTLKSFDVFPAKSVSLNGKTVAYHRPEDPMYAYYFKESNSFKVYRPYNSDYKWMSNVSSMDIQGSQMFEPNKNLFITSSLKDVMVLHELGFMAIAPQAESNRFCEKVIEMMNKSLNTILFYDSDKAGIEAAKARKKEFPFLDLMFIPEEYQVKDPSDFVEEYGREELISLIKKVITYV